MRFILVALFLLLACQTHAQNASPEAIGGAADSPSIEGGSAGETQKEGSETSYSPLRVRIIDDPEDAERAKRREADSDKREADDLAAQQSMAESTERIVVISWYQLGLATAGTVLVFGSLFAAFRSNWIARDTAKRQLRAYVMVESAVVENYGAGKTPIGVVNIKNYGQTPAYNFRHHAGLGVYDLPLVAGLPDLDLDGPNQGAIGPGAGTHVRLTVSGPLSQGLIDKIEAGKTAIVAFGKASYDDAFGQAQSIEFRLYYTGEYRIGDKLSMTFHLDGNRTT